MAGDVGGRSTCELIRFFNNDTIKFEKAQNVFNSTLHVVNVMRTYYPARCLLKLGTDEL